MISLIVSHYMLKSNSIDQKVRKQKMTLQSYGNAQNQSLPPSNQFPSTYCYPWQLCADSFYPVQQVPNLIEVSPEGDKVYVNSNYSFDGSFEGKEVFFMGNCDDFTGNVAFENSGEIQEQSFTGEFSYDQNFEPHLNFNELNYYGLVNYDNYRYEGTECQAWNNQAFQETSRAVFENSTNLNDQQNSFADTNNESIPISNYGLKRCKYFSSKRKCRFGNECKFLHDKSVSPSNDKSVEKEESQVCLFFLGFNGNCRWGKECKFKHVPADELTDYDLKFHLDRGMELLEGHLSRNGMFPSCLKLKKQKNKIIEQRKIKRLLEEKVSLAKKLKDEQNVVLKN